MAAPKDALKATPARIKINDIEIDFAKAMPIKSGDMIVLEERHGIRLMSNTAESLNSVKKLVQFVHHFANVVDQRIREEDVAALPFDVVAWVARWINTNGVRDVTDPNFTKPLTS